MSCTRPIHSRPFDHEAAKAGAPVALECGWPLTIHKWDCNNYERPIVGVYGTDDRLGAWRFDGSFAMSDHSRLALVMIPLGYVGDKPVFVNDELHGPGAPGITLRHVVAPHERDFTGWRWPAPPKVYPKTKSTGGELYDAYMSCDGDGYTSLDHVVNLSIRNFIDNLSTLPDDCALRAKLVELGWTAPDERPF